MNSLQAAGEGIDFELYLGARPPDFTEHESTSNGT